MGQIEVTDLLRGRPEKNMHRFYHIPEKDTEPDSNHDETTHKPKLACVLQNYQGKTE